jgi:hypothetical protein
LRSSIFCNNKLESYFINSISVSFSVGISSSIFSFALYSFNLFSSFLFYAFN